MHVSALVSTLLVHAPRREADQLDAQPMLTGDGLVAADPSVDAPVPYHSGYNLPVIELGDITSHRASQLQVLGAVRRCVEAHL